MKRSTFLMLVVAAACPRFVLAQVTAAQGANAAEIDAEEEKGTRARGSLVARAVDIESMFTGEAKPTLHLTMSDR